MRKIFLLMTIAIMVSISMTSCFVIQDAANAARGISSKTLDADNILQNYEMYFNLYTDVKSKVNMYNSYVPQIKEATGDDKSRMIVERNGIFNYINDVVGQYNAKSKMVNRVLFKDKNLPYQMNFIVTDGVGYLAEE